jgi:hypothetical protein
MRGRHPSTSGDSLFDHSRPTGDDREQDQAVADSRHMARRIIGPCRTRPEDSATIGT